MKSQEGAHLRETLKPKTPSNSLRSFLSSVLFPAPDGPLNTTGLGPAIATVGGEGQGGETERQNQLDQKGENRNWLKGNFSK